MLGAGEWEMPGRGKPWETWEVGATAGLPCDGTHGEARDGERKGKPPRVPGVEAAGVSWDNWSPGKGALLVTWCMRQSREGLHPKSRFRGSTGHWGSAPQIPPSAHRVSLVAI